MIKREEPFIAHEGVKRRSGRYDWGSGEVPYQHEAWFKWGEEIKGLRAEGMTDAEIGRALGIKTATVRARTTVYKSKKEGFDRARAYYLTETKGYSNVEAAKIMGISEGTVRNLLKHSENVKRTEIENTKKVLLDILAKGQYVDVSEGTEVYLGIAKTKLNAVLTELEDEGYSVEKYYQKDATNPRHSVATKVLVPQGVDWTNLSNDLSEREKIVFVGQHSEDGGVTFEPSMHYPTSVSRKRILVRYAEEGGEDKDGLIELRRGVQDISLGDAKYSQVRIAVDDKMYMKGMAVYSDTIPDGYDIVYNTNKHVGADDEKVFKALKKDDPTNPFGASLMVQGGQRWYDDEKTGERLLSPINKVNDEGSWSEWQKHISSQMLSKQDVSLAERQLALDAAQKRQDFDDIMAITNPMVKKRLLESFSDDMDAAAVDLYAAPFPHQEQKVILPVPSLSPNEVYAPHLKDGQRVVLIRFPHGGKFEIPELTVNNHNKEAIAMLGTDPKDAIGINKKTADRLSGADFDGDSVLCIPNDSGAIKTSRALKALEGFDTKAAYPYVPGMKVMTAQQKGMEMGIVSNLITDMTLRGASDAELARAVKHSMVIIDAEKHKLNWKQSELDQNIAELHEKYQGKKTGGASTLISKASSQFWVDDRERKGIDPETGEIVYRDTGRTRTVRKVDKKTGEVTWVREKMRIESTKMAEEKDAFNLSSGTLMEATYATYANECKSLANQARLAMSRIRGMEYSPSAYETYRPEVDSLIAKLNEAKRNRPIERAAQRLAERMIRSKEDSYGEMSKDDYKKFKQRCITTARLSLGTKKRSDRSISITPKEWEAIQAGALRNNRLAEILKEADLDIVRSYATPKDRPQMTDSKVATAKAMLAVGHTLSEVADALGVSTSTISKYT